MINPIVTFIFGVISGCFVVYFLAKAHWMRRLQATKQALWHQYDSDLAIAQQHNRTLESREQHWLKEEAALTQQLKDVACDRTSRQADYENYRSAAKTQIAKLEQQLAQEKRDRTSLQADYDAFKREAQEKIAAEEEKCIVLALEQSEEIEADKRSLQAQVEQLEGNLNNQAIQNQVLQNELAEERAKLKSKLKSAYESAGITYASVAESLFNNIVIQRNSAIEIDKNEDCATAILKTLRAIDDRKFKDSKKVHATGRVWFESTAPGLKMIRIYFRKNKPTSGKCEVLISPKQNSKTQDKDIEWMKNQHS